MKIVKKLMKNDKYDEWQNHNSNPSPIIIVGYPPPPHPPINQWNHIRSANDVKYFTHLLHKLETIGYYEQNKKCHIFTGLNKKATHMDIGLWYSQSCKWLCT